MHWHSFSILSTCIEQWLFGVLYPPLTLEYLVIGSMKLTLSSYWDWSTPLSLKRLSRSFFRKSMRSCKARYPPEDLQHAILPELCNFVDGTSVAFDMYRWTNLHIDYGGHFLLGLLSSASRLCSSLHRWSTGSSGVYEGEYRGKRTEASQVSACETHIILTWQRYLHQHDSSKVREATQQVLFYDESTKSPRHEIWICNLVSYACGIHICSARLLRWRKQRFKCITSEENGGSRKATSRLSAAHFERASCTSSTNSKLL